MVRVKRFHVLEKEAQVMLIDRELGEKKRKRRINCLIKSRP
jgi:hypothetical protein